MGIAGAILLTFLGQQAGSEPETDELLWAERLDRAPAAECKPDWRAPLGQAKWVAQPTWLGNPAPSGAYRADGGGAVTSLSVSQTGAGMKWSWGLPEPVAPEGYRYVSLRYRAVGISPHSDYALCVLGQKRGGGRLDMPVVMPGELVADGRWHVLTAELGKVSERFAAVDGLAVQVQAAAPQAVWELADLRLANARAASRLADAVDWTPGAKFEHFSPVPLGDAARGRAASWQRRLCLADWFAAPAATVHGVPFLLPAGEVNLATTPVRQQAEIRFPCEAAAHEVFLLLLAVLEGEEEPAYGGGTFQTIRDVDRFRLRLDYADGTADECLPMNVATRRFGIVHGLQVVAAAADPTRRLRAVVLRDASKQAAFAVAAITVRTGGERLVPEALEDSSPMRVTGSPAAANGEIQLRSGAPAVVERITHGPARWGLLTEPCFLVKMQVDGKPVGAGDLEPAPAGGASEPAGFVWHRVRTAPGLRLGLAVQMPGGGELTLTARVENRGGGEHSVSLVAPVLGPYRLADKEQDAWYLYPKRGAAVDWRPCSYRERYSGLFPVQFIDTFSPAAGRGLTLRTRDAACLEKYYLLEKNGAQFTLGVEYPQRRLKPNESLQTAAASLRLTDGDGRRGLEAYRAWVRTWHRPLSPRKAWFREVFNFRQRFLWAFDPLYDARSGRLDLQRAVDEARREFGGIDYLHLFDWGNCGPFGRIYGRTGDLSPYDYVQGGRDALHRAIAGIRAQGVPVGLYIEAYLLEKRGKLGQGPGPSWQMLGPDGKGRWWPDSTEMYVCSYVPAWREVQAATYAAKVNELDVDGMYLDEYGFSGPGVDCWAAGHGHPVPGYAAAGERDCTKLVRERIDGAKRGVALYTEETPVDVTTQYQDGSFTYAMSSAASTQTRVPLNAARFALPDFKTIEILYCDKPTGSWATGVKWVFFNGEAIWLEGPAAEWFEPATREAIRRCYAILRKHRDAFTAPEPEPLVPTEIGGVFANAFRVPGKTVYTFYNARHRTVRGDVLRVRETPGAAWHDAWTNRPATVRREGADAVVSLEIGPQDVGCLVATAQGP